MHPYFMLPPQERTSKALSLSVSRVKEWGYLHLLPPLCPTVFTDIHTDIIRVTIGHTCLWVSTSNQGPAIFVDLLAIMPKIRLLASTLQSTKQNELPLSQTNPQNAGSLDAPFKKGAINHLHINILAFTCAEYKKEYSSVLVIVYLDWEKSTHS